MVGKHNAKADCIYVRLQIVGLEDVFKPMSYDNLDDVYIVNDLMDTDLHQIINSAQQLTDEHVQYFVYVFIMSNTLYLFLSCPILCVRFISHIAFFILHMRGIVYDAARNNFSVKLDSIQWRF